MADIVKAGLFTLRDGRMLLCRKKRDTAKLILPGGRIEPGESPLDCLRRELQEELGDRIQLPAAEFLGTYVDIAAGNKTGVKKTVRIELYGGDLLGEPVASSEIGELVWFGVGDDRSWLAPSLVNKIIPDLIARGLLPFFF